MSLKILHTSDIHLGMKFAGYPEVQSELCEARFKTLARLVELANENACDLLVVAGDLFDRISAARKDVIRAAQTISEFQGKLAAVMPGNHDFISRGQSDLWTHFKEHAGDNVLLLEEPRPYSLVHHDLDAFLYPAPCESKHSAENLTGWIRDAEKDGAVRHHIGVAHGSLDGFSPDFDKKYYPMSVKELEGCGLDLWLMGHTHFQYPKAPGDMDRIFYPSTPEPNGFDCGHEGRAWVLEVDDDKRIRPISVVTGTYRFMHDEAEINDVSDLEALKAKYSGEDYLKTLLKLKLKGRLPKDDFSALPKFREELKKRFFHLQVDDSEVTKRLTPEEIDQAFTEGSFPHRLLAELAEKEDLEALQAAYDLIEDCRK